MNKVLFSVISIVYALNASHLAFAEEKVACLSGDQKKLNEELDASFRKLIDYQEVVTGSYNKIMIKPLANLQDAPIGKLFANAKKVSIGQALRSVVQKIPSVDYRMVYNQFFVEIQKGSVQNQDGLNALGLKYRLAMGTLENICATMPKEEAAVASLVKAKKKPQSIQIPKKSISEKTDASEEAEETIVDSGSSESALNEDAGEELPSVNSGTETAPLVIPEPMGTVKVPTEFE